MAQSKPNATMQELAEHLNANLTGNGDQAITKLVHPKLAQGPDHLIYAASEEALQALKLGPANCALVENSLTIPEEFLQGPYSFIVVERIRYALALLLQRFEQPAHINEGIHPTAIIDSTATVHETANIGAYVVIGPNSSVEAHTVIHPHCFVGANVAIGQHCMLHSGVRLGDRVQLGDKVILQFNAAIGADGYSYVTPELSAHESAKQSSGSIQAETTRIERINSIGTVVLEDEVEVGACACIDRGTLAETRIRRGTKIDNLVQIGHNNSVGENCLIVSQVGLSGSCQVGNRVVLAGQVGVADHLKLGDDAIVLAQSGVMRDVEPKTVVGGSPAQERKQAIETLLYTAKLKSMYQDLKALKKTIAKLEADLEQAKAGVS